MGSKGHSPPDTSHSGYAGGSYRVAALLCLSGVTQGPGAIGQSTEVRKQEMLKKPQLFKELQKVSLAGPQGQTPPVEDHPGDAPKRLTLTQPHVTQEVGHL